MYICNMRKHNGIRPQDVAILLKIIAMEKENWNQSALSHSLKISISEVSESLNRSKIASLIDSGKTHVNKQNLLEFLEHGIRYVFPVELGALVKGIPTAHSHPFLKNKIQSNINYVWTDNEGEEVGQMIEPFYKYQTTAVKTDPIFYELMALTDVLRIGRIREKNIAMEELKKIFNA